MSTEERKLFIIEKVMQLNDQQLHQIEDFLKGELLLNSTLEKAMQQVQEGKTKPHTEIREKYAKWL